MKKIIPLITIIQYFLQGLHAQQSTVDSLINWSNSHTKIDSTYILNLHRISYQLCEKEVKISYEYFQKVAYYSDSLGFTYGKALAQINLGILYSNAANYDASNQTYFRAIDFAKSCGALRLQAVSLNNLAENCQKKQDHVKFRQYLREALGINKTLEAWNGVAINYYSLFEYDLHEKLYDSANNNLLKGYAFSSKSKESFLTTQYHTGFGILKAIKNQTDSAVYYFSKASEESIKEGDLKALHFINVAQAEYLENISPAQKLHLLKKAMQLAKQTLYIEGVCNTAKKISFVYDELNIKDSSSVYLKLFINITDSLSYQNRLRNVTIKETEWKIKTKDIENRQLREFTRLQEKELAIKNSWLLGITIFLLLIISIVFSVYKSIKNKKKTTELQLKQRISETEMAALKAQMNPHFIFNCISSIDGLIQDNDKYNATVYLNKFAKLIRNVLDSSKENTVEFEKDIETLQLYIDLEKLRDEDKYTSELNVSQELLESDYEVPPLVIQPFVENAIHHGLRNRQDNLGLLTINVAKSGDYISYTVSDNGVGRSVTAGLRNHSHTSYGVHMSTERIRLFNGESVSSVAIEDLYDAGKPVGTCVKVKLKIK